MQCMQAHDGVTAVQATSSYCTPPQRQRLHAWAAGMGPHEAQGASLKTWQAAISETCIYELNPLKKEEEDHICCSQKNGLLSCRAQ